MHCYGAGIARVMGRYFIMWDDDAVIASFFLVPKYCAMMVNLSRILSNLQQLRRNNTPYQSVMAQNML